MASRRRRAIVSETVVGHVILRSALRAWDKDDMRLRVQVLPGARMHVMCLRLFDSVSAWNIIIYRNRVYTERREKNVVFFPTPRFVSAAGGFHISIIYIYNVPHMTGV